MASIYVRWEELSQKEKAVATLVVGGLYVVECITNVTSYVYEKGVSWWNKPWHTEEQMIYILRYDENDDEEEESIPFTLYYG